MQSATLESRLRDALVPRIEALGCECVELTFAVEAGRRVLRVLVDAPDGVTLDRCAQVSRAIGPVVEAEDGMPSRYVLEVSSPGINRPLVHPEHFRRFLGEQAKIRLKEKLDGSQTVTGVLRDLEGDVLTIETTVGPKQVRLTNIARARLHRDVDAILRAARKPSPAADPAADDPAADRKWKR
jgi:ribosome maturation factor RimP